MSSSNRLGVATGVGLVVANMVGAGVFLSTGFMAQDMSASWILLAWIVGSLLALSGAVTYGAVCRLVPRSGGEYRFLSDLVHPVLGFVAGWASLLLGFSAPIAVDALAAGAFIQTIAPGAHVKGIGVLVVVVVTALHAFDAGISRRAQNGLVAFKMALVCGFLVMCLALGEAFGKIVSEHELFAKCSASYEGMLQGAPLQTFRPAASHRWLPGSGRAASGRVSRSRCS